MQEPAETKILIAEDDEFLRRSIAKFIKQKGYITLEAGNGHEALDLFRAERPSLILTDLRMPVMDGFDLLDEIVIESPKTPVIIFSGVGAKQEIITALRSGAWDYITKPIEDIDFLMNRIERALVQSQMTYGYNETMENALRKSNETLKKELATRHGLEKMIIQAREWERAVDSLSEMIALLDKGHCLVRVNKAMATMLGKGPAEVAGRTCYLSTQGFDNKDVASQDMLALLAGAPQQTGSFYDDRLQARYEVNLTPFLDSNGKTIVGCVYIARDITGRRDTEDKS